MPIKEFDFSLFGSCKGSGADRQQTDHGYDCRSVHGRISCCGDL